MKPMHVTPETMQADGQQLGSIAQQMNSGLGDLANTVQGAGNPWGADEQGSVFGQLYQVVLGKAFQSITSHVQQVDYAGRALSAQAEGYNQIETGTTQQLDTLRAAMG